MRAHMTTSDLITKKEYYIALDMLNECKREPDSLRKSVLIDCLGALVRYYKSTHKGDNHGTIKQDTE